MSVWGFIFLKFKLALRYMFNRSRSIRVTFTKGIHNETQTSKNTSLSKNMLRHENLTQLSDALSYHRSNCSANAYPTNYQTYDEAWEELFVNYDLLRKELGLFYHQVVDMTKQARAHFDVDEIHLGSWLMQDIGEVVRGQPPFAYPEELYRWPKVRLVT